MTTDSPSVPASARRSALQRWVTAVVLALLVPLATYGPVAFGQAGTLVLASLLAGGAVLVVARLATTGTLPRALGSVVVHAVPLLAAYAASTLLNFDLDAAANLAQLVLVVTFMAGASVLVWTRAAFAPLFWGFGSILVTLALWWLASGLPQLFQGGFSHPNALGLFAFQLAFFPLLYLGTSRPLQPLWFIALLFVLCAFLLTYGSTSRATWLAAVVALGFYWAWPIVTRRRTLYMAAFFVTIVLALVMTWLYLLAPDQPWGVELQRVVWDLTGKDLFSGRHLFWGELVSAIQERWLFGYGAGIEAEMFTARGWSSHNLYIHTALQVGAVGLVALVVLLRGIWRQLWFGRHHLVVRLAAAYVIGFLVHQVFEVSLTQVNLANGFLFWLIAGIALSRSYGGDL